MTTSDVAIVGAGPYGLSVAAHLRRLEGLDTKVFGEPMAFWERQMPRGMLLRSPYVASHMSDPHARLTLDTYGIQRGEAVATPVPLDDFVAYGHWFQRQAVPDVDRRGVSTIVPDHSGFRLLLEDGDTWRAQRVIVAAGIAPFAYRPPEFDDVPAALASHVSVHRDLGIFAGRRVLVVGGGQSALESAALVREAGGAATVAIRAREVRWLHYRTLRHQRWISWALYAPPEVGPAGVSHLVARPNLFRLLPRTLQDRLSVRSLRPAGAGALRLRCRDIPIRLGAWVTSAEAAGDGVRVSMNDGTARVFDHVLLGTGYRVDVTRYPFLSPALRAALRRTGGYPQLDAGFESSVPGLHFVGAPAAWSFGPLTRFVAGCAFTARAVARRIDASRASRPARRRVSRRAAAPVLEKVA